MLQRRQWDAVAFVKLPESSIPERNTQHVADERLVTETRTEPRGIVVSPDERDIRLITQVIHHAIAARSAVPTVPANDQFIDRQITDQSARTMNQMQCTITP